MSGQEDILGISMGELSLLLLFSFLLMNLLLEENRLKEKEVPEKGKLTIESVASKSCKNLGCADKPKELKSKLTPSCHETGFQKGYYGTIHITQRGIYKLNGVDYDYTRLHKLIKEDLDNAKIHECVLRLNVSYNDDMSARDLDYSLKKLEKHFYARRI